MPRVSKKLAKPSPALLPDFEHGCRAGANSEMIAKSGLSDPMMTAETVVYHNLRDTHPFFTLPYVISNNRRQSGR